MVESRGEAGTVRATQVFLFGGPCDSRGGRPPPTNLIATFEKEDIGFDSLLVVSQQDTIWHLGGFLSVSKFFELFFLTLDHGI